MEEKNEYIKKSDLEEQTQIILSAFDNRFDVLDKRVDEAEDRLSKKIDNIQTPIDVYVKSQE